MTQRARPSFKHSRSTSHTSVARHSFSAPMARHRDFGLDCYEGGSVVRLVSAHAPMAGWGLKVDPDGGVTLDPAGGSRLQLIKHASGGFSLREPASMTFLSVEGLGEPESIWLTLPARGEWETLDIAPMDGGDGTWSFSLHVRGHPDKLSLSPRSTVAGSPFIRRVPAPGGWEAWRFVLADVPTINISPLVRHAHAVAATDDLRALPDPVQAVIAKIATAAHDIGFYHVVGHRVPTTVFDIAKLHAQELPAVTDGAARPHKYVLSWQDCAPGTPLPPFEVSFDVASHSVPEAWPSSEDPAQLAEYAAACFALTHTLLHALALGQAYETPEIAASAEWWRHRLAPPAGAPYAAGVSAGLRLVHYAPVSSTVPAPLFRMGPHRDATSLTLLAMDGSRGLMVAKSTPKPDAPDAHGEAYECVPVPGALLVNTGMALQEFSKGAFMATCHWVLGQPGAGTRVSMPFFYNANDGVSRTVGCSD